MRVFLAVLAFVVLTSLVLGVTFWVLGRYLGKVRAPYPYYVPVPDPYRPPPVLQTSNSLLVGMLAIVWGLGHLTLAYYLAVLGGGPGDEIARHVKIDSAAFYMMALYIGVAAVLTSVGGYLLILQRSAGRWSIAWGLFLLAIMAFLGGLTMIIVAGLSSIPPALAAAAPFLAAAMVVHMLVDLVLGAAAQRVAKPPTPLDDLDLDVYDRVWT